MGNAVSGDMFLFFSFALSLKKIINVNPIKDETTGYIIV